jgi:hypothetical protein
MCSSVVVCWGGVRRRPQRQLLRREDVRLYERTHVLSVPGK